MILGYNWLQHQNPEVNCKSGLLSLKPTLYSSGSRKADNSSNIYVSEPVDPLQCTLPLAAPTAFWQTPKVALISATAYTWACRTNGTLSFQLFLNDKKTLLGHMSACGEDEPNLDQIPEDYCEFADVFSKNCTKTYLPIIPITSPSKWRIELSYPWGQSTHCQQKNYVHYKIL